MMELKWQDEKTGAIGIAYMTDECAKILEAVGYYHCNEEDKWDGVHIEVWKPKNK